MKENLKYKIYSLLVGMAIGILFFINYYNSSFLYNSDFALYTVYGKDIFNGNVLLSGWYGSTNTFYFLALIYGFFGLIFGYKLELICIVSTFFLIVAATFITYIMLRYTNDKKERFFKVIVLAVLLLSSRYFVGPLKICAGAHFDCALISSVCFYILAEELKEEKFSYKKLLLVAMCLIMAIYSDSLTLFFAVVPFILLILYNMIRKKGQLELKKGIFALSYIISIFVLEKIIAKVIGIMGGIISPWTTNGISFISSEEIFERLEFFIESAFYLFGGNIFGTNINITKIEIFLIVFILFFLIVALLFGRKKLQNDLFSQFNVITILVVAAVLIFTDYVEMGEGAEYTSRLLTFFYFSFLMLFAKIDLECTFTKFNYSKFLRIIIILVCAVVICTQIKQINLQEKEETTYDKIVIALEENNLRKGFGIFWNTHVITVASEFYSEVVPITGVGGISRLLWNSQDPSDWEYANFIIFDDSNYAGVSKEAIVGQIGVPDKIVDVDDTHIYIWEKNILPYINGI